jgi:hypothetical protein
MGETDPGFARSLYVLSLCKAQHNLGLRFTVQLVQAIRRAGEALAGLGMIFPYPTSH